MPAAVPTTSPTASPTATGSPASSPATSPASSAPAASGRQYATPGTRDQQAFISLVAPGAIAAQHRYGVPAAVTIAQAIEESAWGRSGLAAQYHNLFGIKGTGPAGSVTLPTSEFQGGQWVTVDAQFRVYHNDAESIADHAELLATSGYYTRAMADRGVPDAFANDLTGVYATDPEYGANLIALMRLYNLYQFDAAATSAHSAPHATHPPMSPTVTASPTVAPTRYADRRAGGNAERVARGRHPRHGDPGNGNPAREQRRPARPTATGQGAAGRTGFPGAGRAQVPGVPTPALSPTAAAGRGRTGTGPAVRGTTRRAGSTAAATGGIPGLVSPGPLAPSVTAIRYEKQFPHAVTTAFFATAKTPLARGEQLYRDVAARSGIRWKLLAAVDWMQCKADPRYSPVHGEKLGSLNADGTVVRHQVGRAHPVRERPRAARRRRLRHRPHRAAAAVGAGARRRVRRVPLGRAAAAARRVRDGIPLLCRGAHRRCTRRCTGRPLTTRARPTVLARGSASRSARFPSCSASTTRRPSK